MSKERVAQHRKRKEELRDFAFRQAQLPDIGKDLSPLDIWMLFAKIGDETQVMLVKYGKSKGLIPMPMLSEESFVTSLEAHDFPLKVQVLDKKFRVKRIE